MKFGIALMGATLALFGATAAQAQVTISLGSTIPSPDAPGAVQYSGSFAYPGSTDITISGDNMGGLSNGIQFFDALGGQFADGTNDPNLAALPIVMGPTNPNDPTVTFGGVNYSDTDLFELIVPANTPLTTLTYSISTAAGAVLGSTTFTVGGTAVPEPGSIALLAGGLVSGGLFVSRRRRK